MTDEAFELFEVAGYEITSGRGDCRKRKKKVSKKAQERLMHARAFVKIKVGHRLFPYTASAVGEFEAFDTAIRCALMSAFPQAPLLIEHFRPVSSPLSIKAKPSALGLRGEAEALVEYTDGTRLFKASAGSSQTLHAMFMALVGVYRQYLVFVRNTVPEDMAERTTTLDTIPDLTQASHWSATPPEQGATETDSAA